MEEVQKVLRSHKALIRSAKKEEEVKKKASAKEERTRARQAAQDTKDGVNGSISSSLFMLFIAFILASGAKVRKCILCTTRFGQDRILEELAFMWEDYAVWNKDVATVFPSVLEPNSQPTLAFLFFSVPLRYQSPLTPRPDRPPRQQTSFTTYEMATFARLAMPEIVHPASCGNRSHTFAVAIPSPPKRLAANNSSISAGAVRTATPGLFFKFFKFFKWEYSDEDALPGDIVHYF
ncbi:hypothetical protein QR685DRAFT_557206 [Neurospora intermedia]|uniref:Uncharacterized protein n=1 Tax=Neurospora intermedia TaxID=5142 RepID=A0ABR3D338_NEUIN